MKIPNDYMEKSYRMEITEDKNEGGFVVFYPDMPGCITCGETVESAVANALYAKKAWFEAYFQKRVKFVFYLIFEQSQIENYQYFFMIV